MKAWRLNAIGLILFLVGAVLVAACGETATPTPTPPPIFPEQLLETRCTICHSLSRVQSAHKTVTEWEQTVQRMVDMGAALSEAEFNVLVNYLAETYP